VLEVPRFAVPSCFVRRPGVGVVHFNEGADADARNALFHFHAGMIEMTLGDRDQARTDLRQALAINPHFSPLHEPEARRALAQLGAGA